MIYTIKKGNHRSVWFPKITFRKSVCFTFKFLSFIPETDYTNKIYGLIDGIFPHKNSIRIGFRAKNNKIQLCSIIYNNGVRTITVLKEVAPTTLTIGTIAKCKNTYEIWLDFDCFTFPRTSNFNFFSFRLFPYWGGTEVTSQDIKIEIQ